MPITLTTTPASAAWRAVMDAFAAATRVLGEEMWEEASVPMDWYSILLLLSQAEHGIMRPSDLADAITLSRSATTRLIDRMERDDLVERRACPSDRRGTFVGLTDHGEEVFRRAGRVHLRGLNEHIGSHLTQDELRQLSELMRKITDGVQSEVR